MKVFLNPGHAPGGHPDPGAVSPSTAMPLKPKKPTARKPGPVPAVTVAACWRAASRTRLSMPWIRKIVA